MHIRTHVYTLASSFLLNKNLNLSQPQQLQPLGIFFIFLSESPMHGGAVQGWDWAITHFNLFTAVILLNRHMQTPEKHELWQEQGHHVTLDGSDLERKERKYRCKKNNMIHDQSAVIISILQNKMLLGNNTCSDVTGNYSTFIPFFY